MTPSGNEEVEFAQFEPVEPASMKLGPVPAALSDLDLTKLRLGMRVGIFYYQYSLLK